MNQPTYTTKSGSLPDRVIAFFVANPDESLTADDIADKFDVRRSSVHTLLRAPLDAGCLKRTMQEDGYTYTRGDHKPRVQTLPVTATNDPLRQMGAPKPKRKMGSAAAVTVDLDSLVVEEGVPFTGHAPNVGANKWAPLFAKLTKANQSIAIPAHARGAVGAAASKLNKSGKHGKYRVARVPGGARVWRVE